ncbi:MAG: transcriptional regulator [Dokdonella sp.]|nr:MAG: transcriptional regulator [Dokdonella sp.]
MKESDLDRVFQALSSTTRRQILDLVSASSGCTINQVSEQFEMSRVGVLKHVNVLQEAGLLVSEREGRERLLYVNLAPLQVIHERWGDQYKFFWAGRLTRWKYAEAGSESNER